MQEEARSPWQVYQDLAGSDLPRVKDIENEELFSRLFEDFVLFTMGKEKRRTKEGFNYETQAYAEAAVKNLIVEVNEISRVRFATPKEFPRVFFYGYDMEKSKDHYDLEKSTLQSASYKRKRLENIVAEGGSDKVKWFVTSMVTVEE